jgi:hypothetical protein
MTYAENINLVGSKFPEIPNPHNPNVPLILRDTAKMAYAISETGQVPENLLDYTFFNEKTQAFESVTQGFVFQTYQPWNKDTRHLTPFGQTSVAIFEEGLKNAIALRAAKGDNYSFEVQRRAIEFADARKIDEMIRLGELNNNVKIAISPYPSNAKPEVASKLGYFSEVKVAMLRIMNYDPETQILTSSQIMLEQSNNELLCKLASHLTGANISGLGPDDLLALQITLPKNASPNITELARIYDHLLYEKYGNKFFFGKAKVNSHPSYEDVQINTHIIEENSQETITDIVNFDTELAKSLVLGLPSETVRNRMFEAINQTDEKGNCVLTQKQMMSLTYGFNRFNLDTAETIKNIFLIDSYTLLTCVTNPQRAEEIMPKETARKIGVAFKEGVLPSSSGLGSQIYKSIVFHFCGGGIYQMTNPQMRSFFKEGNELKCTCPFCNQIVEAKIHNGRIHCPMCHRSAEYLC